MWSSYLSVLLLKCLVIPRQVYYFVLLVLAHGGVMFFGTRQINLIEKACCGIIELKGDLTNSFSSYRSALQVGVLPFAAPLKLVLIHKK